MENQRRWNDLVLSKFTYFHLRARVEIATIPFCAWFRGRYVRWIHYGAGPYFSFPRPFHLLPRRPRFMYVFHSIGSLQHSAQYELTNSPEELLSFHSRCSRCFVPQPLPPAPLLLFRSDSPFPLIVPFPFVARDSRSPESIHEFFWNSLCTFYSARGNFTGCGGREEKEIDKRSRRGISSGFVSDVFKIRRGWREQVFPKVYFFPPLFFSTIYSKKSIVQHLEKLNNQINAECWK